MKVPNLKKLSPKEWLEYQRSIQGYDSTLIPKDLLSEAFKNLPKECSVLIDLYSGLTKGQIDDRQIQIYFDPLKKLFTPEENKVISKIYFGTFPTFEVNGYAGKTPRGDKIVMIHSALPFTLNVWANFFLYTIEQESWDFLDEDKEEVINLFCWIAKAWKKDFSILPTRPTSLVPKQKESWQLSSVLTHSAMAFILGHEIGHILEGHKGYNPDDQAYNHNLEFAADTWGLRICLRHVIVNGSQCPNTYFPKFMLIGPYLVLSTIATIQDIQGRTHPAASQRLRKIESSYEELLLKIIGKKGLEIYKQQMDIDFLERTFSIGKKLFDRHKLYGEIVNEIQKRIKRE